MTSLHSISELKFTKLAKHHFLFYHIFFLPYFLTETVKIKDQESSIGTLVNLSLQISP